MAFRDDVEAAQALALAAEGEAARLRRELEDLRSGRTDAWSAAAGAVVFVGIGGNVLAMERAAGTVRWQTPLEGRGTVLVSWAHDVLVAATRGELFRLEPTTGGILWRNQLPGLGRGLPTIWIVPEGAAGSGSMLVGIKGSVLAVDLAAGLPLWRRPLHGAGFVGVTLVGRDVLASTAGRLWCLDAATGDVRWHDGLRGLGTGLLCVGAGNFERMATTLRHEELDAEARAAGASAG